MIGDDVVVQRYLSYQFTEHFGIVDLIDVEIITFENHFSEGSKLSGFIGQNWESIILKISNRNFFLFLLALLSD